MIFNAEDAVFVANYLNSTDSLSAGYSVVQLFIIVRVTVAYFLYFDCLQYFLLFLNKFLIEFLVIFHNFEKNLITIFINLVQNLL